MKMVGEHLRIKQPTLHGGLICVCDRRRKIPWSCMGNFNNLVSDSESTHTQSNFYKHTTLCQLYLEDNQPPHEFMKLMTRVCIIIGGVDYPYITRCFYLHSETSSANHAEYTFFFRR